MYNFLLAVAALSSRLAFATTTDVYLNPGDSIFRHNEEFEHVKNVVGSWNPPINLVRVLAPPRLESEISFVNTRYAVENATDRLDIFRVEASWIPAMADSLYDLTPRYGNETSRFDPRAISALNYQGRQLAMPSFLDFQIMYYRKDLLTKYNMTFPSTWDELEEHCEIIQAGERNQGSDDFWCFMWQGSANEILTVLAMQFIASHQGGNIVETDGTISVNNPQAEAALNRVKSWLNRLSPSSLVDQHLHEAKQPFLLEKAAFLLDLTHITAELENWVPAGFDIFQCGNRSFSEFVGMHAPPGLLPTDNVTVGWYWGWGVNKYTPDPDNVFRVYDYMLSEDFQQFKSQNNADAPTLISLQNNKTKACGNTTSPNVCDIDVPNLNVLTRALEHYGSNYFSASKEIFGSFHNFLDGTYQTANEALGQMECGLYKALNMPVPQSCRPDENYNYLPTFVSIMGTTVFSINVLTATLCAIWVFVNRKEKVVLASQPDFLYLVCLGCLISSVPLLFIGRDDQHYSSTTLTNMCQATVWFYSVGFALSITSLMAKTMRVKILMIDVAKKQTKNTARATSRLWFFSAMATAIIVEVVYVSIWMYVAPVEWKRRCTKTDEDLGYCETSVANCSGTYETLGFLSGLLAIHVIYLIYTLYLCYLCRNVPSEFSEHKWITAASISTVEILLIAPPIIALSWSTSPIVTSVILAFALFASDFGVLSMVFFPKIMSKNEVYDEAKLRNEDVLFNLRRKARNITAKASRANPFTDDDLSHSQDSKMVAKSSYRAPSTNRRGSSMMKINNPPSIYKTGTNGFFTNQ
mmetsp:Transcript_29715/g.52156  ORF Transcript_29715/g.52156 Transcript_29715/m.52156 type:complete len:809 (-) Transcript_29715:304-2730(-)